MQNKMIKEKFKEIFGEIKDYIYIAVALSIYAAGVTLFLLPYQITTGGVTGIASLVYYATGLEVQVTYLTINAILLLMAVKIIGWRFCVKTIYGVLLLTFYLWFLQRLIEDPVTGELPKLVGDQSFMAVTLGAILEGIALGICFAHQGSTGGTDIIAAIVNKYKDMSLGHLMMIMDCIIISSCYFIFHDWEKIVFGFVALVISGLTLDHVMYSTRQSVQFFIFSRNYRKIATKLNEKGFGVTVLDGTGWYTQTERKVIVLVAHKRQSTSIFRYIKSIDPYAFVSMNNCQGVYGEGFDAIKAKLKQKPTLVFATNNQHKLREVKEILGSKFDIRSLEDIGCNVDIPETANTFEGNALQKAQFVKKYYGFDCFADDTGLEVNALGGEPGVYSARYAGEDHNFEANTDKLLRNMEGKDDRSAKFTTVIALIYNGETHFFEGTVNGHIITERKGDAGFGYDPVFVPDGYDKTFAELGDEIKNQISHRAEAVNKLCGFLKV